MGCAYISAGPATQLYIIFVGENVNWLFEKGALLYFGVEIEQWWAMIGVLPVMIAACFIPSLKHLAPFSMFALASFLFSFVVGATPHFSCSSSSKGPLMFVAAICMYRSDALYSNCVRN